MFVINSQHSTFIVALKQSVLHWKQTVETIRGSRKFDVDEKLMVF